MRIFFLVLSLSLILTSCGTKNSSKQSQEVPVNSPGVSYSETLENTSSKIKNTKEFEECMRPSVNMCVNQVGNQLARAQKSTAFCDEIAAGGGQDGCKFGVVMAQVSETKDIKLCDTLTTTYKKECRISTLLEDAVSSKDLRKCDLIDSEAPSQSGSTDRFADRAEQCRADLIMRKQDAKPTDCDILKSGTSKDMCKAIVKSRAEGIRALPEKAN